MTTIAGVDAQSESTFEVDPPASSQRGRAAVAIALIVGANASAFAYTLTQVVEGVDLTSPVAYVPFVPLVALIAAAQRWRGDPSESPMRAHRSADWITFVGLAVASLLVGRGLSSAFTTETLTWRVDLATVPLVAAAVIVALFGLRMLWRLRTVLWFLTLMSPALYRPIVILIRSVTSTSTEFAAAVMAGVLPFVEGSKAVAAGRDVGIKWSGEIVTLRVAEVCAGNGAVLAGMFVAASMWMLTVGSRQSKMRWAALCIGACWVGNLARLVALFFATSISGAGAATGWFHELAGMVTLVLALGVALAFATRFGLAPRPVAAGATTDPTPPRLGAVAVGTLLIFVVVMWNITGTATNRFNLMTGRSAEAAVSVESTLNSWSEDADSSTASVIRTENVSWAADFFGRGARWQTFLARPSGAAAVIGVDLVSTDQPTSLDAYGLAACLGFHGWRMDMNQVVAMPGGRQAEQIVYTVRGSAAQEQAGTPDGATRSVALISWRQLTAEGRVERITLQQPQTVGDWSMTDLENLASELMDATDSAVVS